MFFPILDLQYILDGAILLLLIFKYLKFYTISPFKDQLKPKLENSQICFQIYEATSNMLSFQCKRMS